MLEKILKKLFRKLGLRILKEKNYLKLVKNSSYVSGVNSKNRVLDLFFNTIKKQGFKPVTIIDVGAHKGTWTKECMKFFPVAKYYLFEPQQNLCKDIRNNLEGIGNYTIFTTGVGNKNLTANFTLHDREDSRSFSFSKEEAEERGYIQTKIPVVRLDDFVKENNLDKPDLIKIDAEGFDLEVLEGAIDILNNTEVILVEAAVMNKRLKNSALSVIKYLDDLDYKLFDITDINRPFNNNVLWLCEFAFIKKNGILDKNYLA